MRFGKQRIEPQRPLVDRVLEQTARLSDHPATLSSGPVLQQCVAAQTVVVRRQVSRCLASRSDKLGLLQMHHQGVDNLLRQLVLKSEYVGELTIISLGPY